jgi:hypothetical protein
MNIFIIHHPLVNAKNDMDIIRDHGLTFLFYLGGLLYIEKDRVRFALH